jgi:hypothetical protein
VCDGLAGIDDPVKVQQVVKRLCLDEEARRLQEKGAQATGQQCMPLVGCLVWILVQQ